VKLTKEQILRLKLSDEDIESGNLISHDQLVIDDLTAFWGNRQDPKKLLEEIIK